MINVTKTYLPPFEEYTNILSRAWNKSWITNNGELVQELEQKLKDYLGVKHLFFTNNGTVVLQMSLKALNITKEVITTPFSYVATSNAILWEGCKPVFVDIDPNTFCIDTRKIEKAINEDTQAILSTHVYGFPCEIESIQKIADKYQLKVIYDGAHAFGCTYKGKSLLSYGDISTCSFHATKLFHTVEGGCIITNDDEIARQLYLFRQFGHIYDEYFSIGINAKNSEFHAAMGLALLPYVPALIDKRKNISEEYDRCFQSIDKVSVPPKHINNFHWNYSYYPIMFSSEEDLLKVKTFLMDNDINTRRYFYPSLNELPFLNSKFICSTSEDISRRVLCLPFYPDLENEILYKVCNIIKSAL